MPLRLLLKRLRAHACARVCVGFVVGGKEVWVMNGKTRGKERQKKGSPRVTE